MDVQVMVQSDFVGYNRFDTSGRAVYVHLENVEKLN